MNCHSKKKLDLNNYFFVKLSEDLFLFTEREGRDQLRFFLTDSKLQVLGEHYLPLPDTGMLWNLSTRAQPYGNQHL